MNLSGIVTTVTRFGGRSLLLAQKHSPEILTAAGIVGGVSAAVMASKATLRAVDVVDDTKADVRDLKNMTPAVEQDTPEFKRELAYVYTQGGLKLVKIYAPAVTMGLLSVVSIVGAQGILNKRNVAVMAAYKALEKTFTDYQERVASEYGEEAEQRIRRAESDEEVEVVDPVTGKKRKKHVSTFDPNKISVYSRVFAEGNPMWSREPQYNLFFLKAEQNQLNDRLHHTGHVFLNEVYDRLGFPRTKEGAVVGWILNADGDNYIDFGMYNMDSERARDFINGYEPSILLDFNVDGVIFDKI